MTERMLKVITHIETRELVDRYAMIGGREGSRFVAELYIGSTYMDFIPQKRRVDTEAEIKKSLFLEVKMAIYGDLIERLPSIAYAVTGMAERLAAAGVGRPEDFNLSQQLEALNPREMR